MVGSFAEHVSEQTIATLRNRTAMLLTATRSLGRHDSRVGHQLGRGSETPQTANLGDDGDCAQKADATKRLQRPYQGDLSTGLGALAERRLETFDALAGRGDFSQVMGDSIQFARCSNSISRSH